jgi:hypothetical protein
VQPTSFEIAAYELLGTFSWLAPRRQRPAQQLSSISLQCQQILMPDINGFLCT